MDEYILLTFSRRRKNCFRYAQTISEKSLFQKITGFFCKKFEKQLHFMSSYGIMCIADIKQPRFNEV